MGIISNLNRDFFQPEGALISCPGPFPIEPAGFIMRERRNQPRLHPARNGRLCEQDQFFHKKRRKIVPETRADKGKVTSHERKILEMTSQRAFRETIPIPKREPQETWVVETGQPHREAKMTRNAVTRFAVNPCPWFNGVIFPLMVSATFLALRMPPTAIPNPTIRAAPFIGNRFPARSKAMILGVSLSPLENETQAAEK